MGKRVIDITVKGEMTRQLQGAFEDVDVTVERGVTRLHMVSRDASTLHGLLDRVDTLGLELLDVSSRDDEGQHG